MLSATSYFDCLRDVKIPGELGTREMNTLTIKIPPQLEQDLILASEREHLSKSELVRRALVAYVSQRKAATPAMSALDQAGDLVGCFVGGPTDLSSNPRHLDDFGRV